MLGGGLTVVGVLFSVEFQDFDNNSAAFKNLVDSMKEVVSPDSTTVVIVQNKLKKKDDYLLYDFTVKIDFFQWSFIVIFLAKKIQWNRLSIYEIQ